MTSPGYPDPYDPSDPRQPPVPPGAELAGKYRIDRVIGAGAMGIVVQAWHIELEQQVAVKFLYPEFARHSDGAERFRREARAAAKIKNQHVARVLDVGLIESKNIPYIVMEYLAGRDLARELSERGRLPVELAVRYVLQACEAVAEAHQHGIVHRDLKPANLFLAEGSGGSRMIKVLDFGISKVNGSGPQQFSLTDTATLMGSPAYMSPEQLESSRNVDARADIWSLGVILHELVLGRVPFTGDSVPQLVRAILSGSRSTLMERDPSLEGLEHVVARCLSQERQLRFESVPLLRDALLPFAQLAGHPTPLSRGTMPLGVAAPSVTPAPNRAADGAEASLAFSAARSAIQTQASVAGIAATEPVAVPPEPVEAPRDPVGATGGVPSAWGNTQRGRHRSWQRGVPVAVVLALLALGGYWLTALRSSGPLSSPLSADGASAPERGAALGAQPLVMPAPQAAVPQAKVAEVTAPSSAPAMAPGAATSPSSPSPAPSEAPSVHLVDATPNASAVVANPAGAARVGAARGDSPSTPHLLPAPTALTPVAPHPQPAVTAPGAPHASGSAGSDKSISDKPKLEPSHHGPYEVPNFGGRE